MQRQASNLEQIHILERIAEGAPLKEVLERIVLLIEQQGRAPLQTFRRSFRAPLMELVLARKPVRAGRRLIEPSG